LSSAQAHRFGAAFEARVLATGLRFVPLDAGLAVLAALARGPATNAAVLPADWALYGARRAAARLPPHAVARDLVAAAAPAPEPRLLPRSFQSAPELRQMLKPDTAFARDVGRCATPAQGLEYVSGRVRGALRELTGDEGDWDGAAPLATLGVTSLHAVSLAAKLSDAAALDLAPTLVFEHVSIDGVAAHILSYFADDEAPVEHPARRPSLVSARAPAAALAVAGSCAEFNHWFGWS
jgi:hypothetical protein